MAFKIKDLMIEVLAGSGGVCPTVSVGAAAGDQCPTLSVDPAQAQCPTLSVDPARAFGGGATGICPTLSVTPTPYAALACTLSATPVTLALAATCATTLCGTLTMPGLALSGAENLAALKQQLRQALELIEAQERAAAKGEAGLPRTVEEADDLEQRLRQAMDELQQHRKTLEKPGTEGAKTRKGRK